MAVIEQENELSIYKLKNENNSFEVRKVMLIV